MLTASFPCMILHRRNLACIGCGCPRSGNAGPQTTPGIPVYTSPVPPVKSAHPLLTPSGRAFAIGGRVQNISSDPLSPCIMYWPDNEPFPEQGQIRPGNLVGVPVLVFLSPLVNSQLTFLSATPHLEYREQRSYISCEFLHRLVTLRPLIRPAPYQQPGDWVCLKCNYLNWRRRKVCQTCLPCTLAVVLFRPVPELFTPLDAEGNGDSISAAVQAERIALLTSVLTQTQNHTNRPARPQAGPSPPSRSFSPMSLLQQREPPTNFSMPPTLTSLPHSPPHVEDDRQIASSRPIYQTSGHRQPSPLYTTGPDFHSLPVHTPAPLLPSFLQDIVQSPTLSPASTSSADLSFEEYDDFAPSKTTFPRTHSGESDSAADSPFGNIWRLDGEECKSLSAFPLPNRQELIGAGGKHDRDVPVRGSLPHDYTVRACSLPSASSLSHGSLAFPQKGFILSH